MFKRTLMILSLVTVVTFSTAGCGAKVAKKVSNNETTEAVTTEEATSEEETTTEEATTEDYTTEEETTTKEASTEKNTEASTKETTTEDGTETATTEKATEEKKTEEATKEQPTGDSSLTEAAIQGYWVNGMYGMAFHFDNGKCEANNGDGIEQMEYTLKNGSLTIEGVAYPCAIRDNKFILILESIEIEFYKATKEEFEKASMDMPEGDYTSKDLEGYWINKTLGFGMYFTGNKVTLREGGESESFNYTVEGSIMEMDGDEFKIAIKDNDLYLELDGTIIILNKSTKAEYNKIS